MIDTIAILAALFLLVVICAPQWIFDRLSRLIEGVADADA